MNAVPLPRQRDGPVPRALHMRHGHELYVMADVEAVRRRVKADIERDFFFAEQLFAFFGMGTLL